MAGPKLTRTPISQDPQTGVLSFILTFDGTLQDSADGIKWKDVTAASRGRHPEKSKQILPCRV